MDEETVLRECEKAVSRMVQLTQADLTVCAVEAADTTDLLTRMELQEFAADKRQQLIHWKEVLHQVHLWRKTGQLPDTDVSTKEIE